MRSRSSFCRTRSQSLRYSPCERDCTPSRIHLRTSAVDACVIPDRWVPQILKRLSVLAESVACSRFIGERGPGVPRQESLEVTDRFSVGQLLEQQRKVRVGLDTVP